MKKTNKVIEIKKGYEHMILTDTHENMFDPTRFFYPVYEKCRDLIDEICKNTSEMSKNGFIDYPNNLIMFCAERGGGKSTALSSVSNWLKNDASKDRHYEVLQPIDPTNITEKDYFMRIILSRMFSRLRFRWKNKQLDHFKFDYNNHYQSVDTRQAIINKFMECYRLLDVIYQSGGKFDYNDDLETLTDLGDSGNLKEKFYDLVVLYLKEITGVDSSDNSFLVIQVDDADLNPKMGFNIIEDIRKYCIIPNVIILSAINLKQMHQVIEQHFVDEFKPLLSASKDNSDISLHDCYKMSVRYIDKVMPVLHRIHLPVIDDYISDTPSEITVKYYSGTEDLLNFDTQKRRKKSMRQMSASSNGYQESLLTLIYRKTGIPLIKPKNHLHYILPRTMRGLCHFLAYMSEMPDLNDDYTIAEANMICKDIKVISSNNSDKSKVLKWLNQHLNNLEAFDYYFLSNWCTVRLPLYYKHIIDEIASASFDQKVPTAIKCINNLLNGNEHDNKETDEVAGSLSDNSFAYLKMLLKRLTEHTFNKEDLAAVNMFAYAVKFYFTLFFYRVSFIYSRNGTGFSTLLNYTEYEVWEPDIKDSEFRPIGKEINRFEIRGDVLLKLLGKNRKKILGLEEVCMIDFDGTIKIMDDDIYYEFINNRGDILSYKIFSDLGCMLFYNLNNNKFDIETQNAVFELLFNCDVQRFAENSVNIKKIYLNTNNNKELLSVNSLRKRLLSVMHEELHSIFYIPAKREYKISDNRALNIISLANERIAIKMVEFFIDFVCRISEEYVVSEYNNDKFENQFETILGNILIIFAINDKYSDVYDLTVLSGIFKKSYSQWEQVYSQYNDIRNMMPDRASWQYNNINIQSFKKRMSSAESTLHEWLHIKENEEQIINEVKDNFKK